MYTTIYNRAMFVLIVLLIGCSGAANEEKAQAIFQHAQSLEKQGRIIEALQAYDRLIDYKKTKIFKTAEAYLLKDGITIGKGIHSWSIKKMFAVKNQLIRKGAERHPDGDVVVPLSIKDGWGSYLRVEYSTGPKFIFGVLSGGPDGKLGTGDDLRLYHQKDAQSTAPASARSPRSGTKKSSHLAESSVEIEDLLQGKIN